MHPLFEVAHTGLVAVWLHPLRSLVTTGVLMAVLVPYLAGLGLSNGIQQQADDSIRFGADLYVTGTQFGCVVPLPLSAVAEIQQIEGVTAVVPRIVGGLELGKNREHVVLVGIPRERFPSEVTCVEGRLYDSQVLNEFVVGSELARRLALHVDSVIPPFYHNAKGERLSKVVGIFKSDVSIWQSNLMFTSFETASQVFDQSQQATSLLVYCRPGYAGDIKTAIRRMFAVTRHDDGAGIRSRVVAKSDLQSLIPGGLLHREGIFNLHFLLVFAVAILVVLVTSGLGLSARRREIGILKATGWQTDEILLRGAVESLLLSLAAAAASVVLAYLWLKGLNGYWIASVFLAGVDSAPGFKVPFRLTPVPVLLTFLISLVVVMSGTLYSSWRSATVSPMEAMR